eukprot:6472028-Amphidinium_carterae.1
MRQHTNRDPTHFGSSGVKVIDAETDVSSDDCSQLLSLDDEDQCVSRIGEQDIRLQVSFHSGPGFLDRDKVSGREFAPVSSLAF